jgi:hypothetical protein
MGIKSWRVALEPAVLVFLLAAMSGPANGQPSPGDSAGLQHGKERGDFKVAANQKYDEILAQLADLAGVNVVGEIPEGAATLSPTAETIPFDVAFGRMILVPAFRTEPSCYLRLHDESLEVMRFGRCFGEEPHSGHIFLSPMKFLDSGELDDDVVLVLADTGRDTVHAPEVIDNLLPDYLRGAVLEDTLSACFFGLGRDVRDFVVVARLLEHDDSWRGYGTLRIMDRPSHDLCNATRQFAGHERVVVFDGGLCRSVDERASAIAFLTAGRNQHNAFIWMSPESTKMVFRVRQGSEDLVNDFLRDADSAHRRSPSQHEAENP